MAKKSQSKGTTWKKNHRARARHGNKIIEQGHDTEIAEQGHDNKMQRSQGHNNIQSSPPSFGALHTLSCAALHNQNKWGMIYVIYIFFNTHVGVALKMPISVLRHQGQLQKKK